MRVLFIARYRDPSMHRKIHLMAQARDVTIRAVYPARWNDGLVDVAQAPGQEAGVEQQVLSMIGSPTDPHRALYRTLSFGMRDFRPHIVHAEEEPDSLTGLQVAICRRLFAPQARLLFHTWQNQDRHLSWSVRWVLERTLAAADAIFCANQEAVALLEQRGYTRPTPLIPAVGVDTALFVPRTSRADGPFVVGFVGRLVVEKGIDTLIDAVARLAADAPPRPLQLRIIGAGPEELALRRRVDAAGLGARVDFVPPAPPAQIAGLMAELDVLVLPSRTTVVWKEQLGRVLLEAMATGVPAIGSDSGAIPEVIGDAGLIFPEGDVAGLAGALGRLLTDPALARALAERGVVRAREEYSQSVLAARTVDFYRKVMAGP